jgi:hypothetical protein
VRRRTIPFVERLRETMWLKVGVESLLGVNVGVRVTDEG